MTSIITEQEVPYLKIFISDVTLLLIGLKYTQTALEMDRFTELVYDAREKGAIAYQGNREKGIGKVIIHSLIQELVDSKFPHQHSL